MVAWRMTAALLTLVVALCAGMTLTGCDDTAAAGIEVVEIEGRKFFLELAADDASRTKGLGDRTFLAEDGGMLFVFAEPRRLNFVMRDCFVEIDVIFLDQLGNVTAVHHMPLEEPQGETEGDWEYEMRLKRYPSRMAAQFAIELRGGMAAELGVKAGDTIKLDLNRLKSLAQ